MSNGSNLWEFDLVGIFTDIDNPGNEEQVFMNYQYFDEARESYTKGTVGNFIVKLMLLVMLQLECRQLFLQK